jgi:hypothetical protein
MGVDARLLTGVLDGGQKGGKERESLRRELRRLNIRANDVREGCPWGWVPGELLWVAEGTWNLKKQNDSRLSCRRISAHGRKERTAKILRSTVEIMYPFDCDPG